MGRIVQYVIALIFMILIVFIAFQTWCFFVIHLVNPIFVAFGAPEMSTHYCDIAINFGWLGDTLEQLNKAIANIENFSLPQIPIPEISISFSPILIIIGISAAIVVILLITTLLVQISSNWDTFENKIQDWYSSIITILPFERIWPSNPNKLDELKLKVEIAVPEKVYVGEEFILAIAINRVLNEKKLSNVESGEINLIWSESQSNIWLQIKIIASSCEIVGDNRPFRLKSKKDTKVRHFQLVPNREGDISITVEVYQLLTVFPLLTILFQKAEHLDDVTTYTRALISKIAGNVPIKTTSYYISSPTTYNLQNIRVLLTQGFTENDLRRFCFETNEFRPAYNQLSDKMGKDMIIDILFEYADKQGKMEVILNWAKKENINMYERFSPYTDDKSTK